MTTQTEMFPKTELDEATAVLSHLLEEKKKAVKACGSADDKLDDCIERVRQQQHVVDRLQSMMPAAEPFVDGEPAEDADSEPIAEIEGDVLDPITGEVTSIPEAFNDLWTCPTCQGDGRILDKTGGGHHKCKACDGTGHQYPSCDNCTISGCNLKQQAASSTMGCGGKSWLHGEMMGEAGEPPCVFAVYPSDLDDEIPHRTEVGPLTRYGELAADFLASLPNGDPRRRDAFTDYRIIDVDADVERDPHAVIAPADYGLEFTVEARAQAEESAA